MKSNLNKIILTNIIFFFLSSCHTLDHRNTFSNTIKKDKEHKIIYKDMKTKDKVLKNKDLKEIEMAPINVPKQKQKVKTLTIKKKVERPKSKRIDLSSFKNWSEEKLINKMGQGDFTKGEGKLRNYQYHFSSCFLDIFLTKKKNGFFVSYIQTRSTKLFGHIETSKCLKEINSKLN